MCRLEIAPYCISFELIKLFWGDYTNIFKYRLALNGFCMCLWSMFCISGMYHRLGGVQPLLLLLSDLSEKGKDDSVYPNPRHKLKYVMQKKGKK